MKHSIQENSILKPKTPTFERYFNLRKNLGDISLTRALQYEQLGITPSNGRLLDVGGGENASYRHLLNCSVYDSINIDIKAKPTWIVEVGEKFPVKSQRYDVVLSLNTLEHVFDPIFVLKEAYRTLVNNGQLVVATPFLLPIHAHPDDFFRPTHSWFKVALQNLGYKEIKIIPLGWGPFTTGLASSGVPGLAKKVRKDLYMIYDLLYAYIQTARRSETIVSDTIFRHALSFFVTARKRSSE